MFSLIAALAFAMSEPQAPKGIPWPGGVWPADGKEYPAGSFIWIKKAELDAYLIAHAKWADAHPAVPLVRRATFAFDFFALADTLPRITWEYEAGSISGTAPVVVYGGTGTIAAAYSAGKRRIDIILNNSDVAKLLKGINLRPPVQVTGTCGLLTGTIEGDTGKFVGTEMKTNGGIVSRVELTVDLKTGAYTSIASTTYGRQTLTGRLTAIDPSKPRLVAVEK